MKQGSFHTCLSQKYNRVDMIWHDDYFIENHRLKLAWQPEPTILHDLSPPDQLKPAVLNCTQATYFPLDNKSHKIGPHRRIIPAPQAWWMSFVLTAGLHAFPGWSLD